jgi:hypothetical protein
MEVSLMPKARAHKKSSAVRNGPRAATVPGKNTTLAVNGQNSVKTRPATTNISGMIMPGMLGCWGMAFTFTVFSTDPNRLLFGGMAALMALMWSVSFGVRVRKVVRQK